MRIPTSLASFYPVLSTQYPEQSIADGNAKMNMSDDDLVSLVRDERTDYERNSQDMRELLRKAYRNFMGIFDEPYTRYTKRKKEFWNATQYAALTSASRVFVDARAVTILPQNESDKVKAMVWGELIPFQMRQIGLFAAMNEFSISLAMMGTVVSAQDWEFKKEQYIDKDGKTVKERIQEDHPSYKILPLLSCFLDMTVDSLHDSPSFIVETWYEVAQLPALKERYGWKYDVSNVPGTKLITQDPGLRGQDILRYQQMGVTQRQMEIPMVKLLWRWGKIRLSWKTKKKEDEDTWVEGVIVTLENGTQDSTPVLVDCRVNPFEHGKRPFEECWYVKIPGRWYGLGVGEMLLDYQSNLNRVKNQRTDNNEILQNRMFKARRGSGLDNKTLISTPGKVVTVQNMDDLQVLDTGDAQASTYTDEQDIMLWMERITHVKDAAGNPSSATEAQINESNANDFFAIVRRNINDYLKRVTWHIIQLDRQFIDKEMTIRIVGEPSEFRDLDELRGIPEELRSQMGNMRFMEIKDISEIDGEYDIEVDIDNSIPMNKAMQLQAIEKLLAMASRDPNSGVNRQEAYKEWAQLAGLKGSRFFLNTDQQSYLPMPGQQVLPGQSPQGTPFQGTTNPGQGEIQQQLPERVGTQTLYERNSPQT